MNRPKNDHPFLKFQRKTWHDLYFEEKVNTYFQYFITGIRYRVSLKTLGRTNL